MTSIRVIRSRSEVRDEERGLSDAQRAADPALVAAGWEWRFIADAHRIAEARALYEQIGFEVRTEPLPGIDEAGDCAPCQDTVRHFLAIYTRRRADSPVGGD